MTVEALLAEASVISAQAARGAVFVKLRRTVADRQTGMMFIEMTPGEALKFCTILRDAVGTAIAAN